MHQSIDASAFVPEWGPEAVAGTIVLSNLALRFESEQCALEIPMNRLAAEVQPGAEPRIAFTDPEQPGAVILTTELELLACPLAPLTKARADCASRLSRHEMKRRWRVLVGFLVGCAVITVLGGIALSLMVRAIANRITPERDAQFGAMMMESVSKEAELVKDSNAVARIEALAEPLVRVLPSIPNGYRFHLIRDDEPNAFALPGGHIVVHTGLLELTDQPEEILGVLAHEVAHVSERHIYPGMISTAGPLLICELFFSRGGGLGSLVGGGAALLVGAGFSQEHETEADETGWEYMMKARIDPRGMIRVFQKLQRHHEQHSGPDLMPAAFQSHPAVEKRIKRLEARWAKLRRKPAFLEFPEFSPVPKSEETR